MLSACGGRQTSMESADMALAGSTEVMKETVAMQPRSYRLTGTVGEDKASMVLEKSGSDVMGTVTRCDFCVPINVDGIWQGDNIKVEGVSLAGSHIEYELTVTGDAVKGTETLSAEGMVEEQSVTMTIEQP